MGGRWGLTGQKPVHTAPRCLRPCSPLSPGQESVTQGSLITAWSCKNMYVLLRKWQVPFIKFSKTSVILETVKKSHFRDKMWESCGERWKLIFVWPPADVRQHSLSGNPALYPLPLLFESDVWEAGVKAIPHGQSRGCKHRSHETMTGWFH